MLLAGDTPLVIGSIDVPGEVDQYGFDLKEKSWIIFDSLTIDSNFDWSLSGPHGTEVANRSFSNSDSIDSIASPLLDLSAGSYTLTVKALGDTIGPYSFRLIDVQQTEIIAPGTLVSGALDPANETDAYRFIATTGERYYFDRRTFDGGDVYWRLVDPSGGLTFDRTSLGSDVRPLTLATTGTYTLLAPVLRIETHHPSVDKAVDEHAVAIEDGEDDDVQVRSDQIIVQIRSGRSVRARAIAKAIRCSLRTVKRDLDALKAEGAVLFDGPSKIGRYSVKG